MDFSTSDGGRLDPGRGSRIGLGVEIENADGHGVEAGPAGDPRPLVDVEEFEAIGCLPHRERTHSPRRPDGGDEGRIGGRVERPIVVGGGVHRLRLDVVDIGPVTVPSDFQAGSREDEVRHPLA